MLAATQLGIRTQQYDNRLFSFYIFIHYKHSHCFNKGQWLNPEDWSGTLWLVSAWISRTFIPQISLVKHFLQKAMQRGRRKATLRDSVCVCVWIYKKQSLFYTHTFSCFYCLVAKSCLTLCNPMDCSLQGSSVHVISLARILEWVAISFSRGSSQPRDPAHVFSVFTEPAGQPIKYLHANSILFSTWR